MAESVTMKVVLAGRFLVFFVLGFSIGMSEFALIWVSHYLRMPIQYGAYPLPVFLAVVFVAFFVGAFLRKRIGYGLIAGTFTGAICFWLLLAISIPYALMGGD